MDWELFLKLVWYNKWIQTDLHYTLTLTAISAKNIIIVFFGRGTVNLSKLKCDPTHTTKCRCYYCYFFDSLLQRNRLDLKLSWMIFPRRNLKVSMYNLINLKIKQANLISWNIFTNLHVKVKFIAAKLITAFYRTVMIKYVHQQTEAEFIILQGTKTSQLNLCYSYVYWVKYRLWFLTELVNVKYYKF